LLTLIKGSTKAVFFSALFALQIGAANAVVVDGVLDAPGAADNYANSFVTSWTNGHQTENSIYADGLDNTNVRYTQDGDMLFLYMEVPLYAKNMIWGDGVTAQDILDYNGHYTTHHDDLTEITYSTATGSEKTIFNGGVGVVFAAKKGKDDKDGGGGDYVGDLDGSYSGIGITEYATSHDYLIFGTGECDTTNCSASDTKMSFEFKFNLVAEDQDMLLDGIQTDGIEFHLSPEKVPVPAAVWLFGSALMGMGAIARRKKA
jgi:hypothetical protein